MLNDFASDCDRRDGATGRPRGARSWSLNGVQHFLPLGDEIPPEIFVPVPDPVVCVQMHLLYRRMVQSLQEIMQISICLTFVGYEVWLYHGSQIR
jgi:hypothetical protein